MLKSLRIRDFTVFKGADLEFAKGLNVIVGAKWNGHTVARASIATTLRFFTVILRDRGELITSWNC